MLNKPRFKPCFHITSVEAEAIYLLSEQGHFVLSGSLYVLLAPLLDGHNTVDEIVGKLRGQFSSAAVYYALMLLDSKGYITEADDTLSPEIAAFWNLLGVDTLVASDRLQATKVSVSSFGKVPTELFVSTLKSLNINVSNEGDFTVVLTDDYLQIGLDTFNQEALRSRKPWMLVKPVGAVIWVGPIFSPGKTACWECLSQRLRGNREVETAIQQQKAISSPFPISCSILPSSLQTGLNLAATEVAKWVVCRKHEQLEGKLITLNLVSLSLQHHVLVKRPQCLECGVAKSLCDREPEPLVLTSRRKQFIADGGHRSISPEQTVRQYEHHVSPITGVISNLQRVTQVENSLVHVYIASHKFSRNLDSLDHLRQTLRRNSAGKGKTDLQAKASALCEAIERYSGLYTGNETRVTGTYIEMGDAAIHPNTCTQFSAAQYCNRHEWNQQHSRFQWIPEPFDEKREIEWTPVWSLTHQASKYLPTGYCYYNYPFPSGYRFCKADSNGNAAGNTYEEAILQGFMELVERDSVALWWYNRLKRPAVDLESFDEPYLQAVQNYYTTLNREIWVLDITSDLNIPAFAAISRCTNKEGEEILLGFGVHFDPKIAILRAVTEINQKLPFANSAIQPNQAEFHDPDRQNWLTTATLENQPYLVPDGNVASKCYSDYLQQWSDDLREDVLSCVDIAAKHGMETFVLDQTQPDIGLKVVKVVVPGLRHFWARFAPGRLYDVPVELGWLPKPLTESQFNPIPMFL